jgi:hypothetical protein
MCKHALYYTDGVGELICSLSSFVCVCVLKLTRKLTGTLTIIYFNSWLSGNTREICLLRDGKRLFSCFCCHVTFGVLHVDLACVKIKHESLF